MSDAYPCTLYHLKGEAAFRCRLEKMEKINDTVWQEYRAWEASSLLSKEEREELCEIGRDEERLLLAFGGQMSFGTAGLRAEMGMGTNRMNRFTVAQTTQGIAQLVLEAGGADKGVAIACDSRNHSEEFAKTAASVLAANGIRVYLFDALRPTPELSFAIRHYGCMAGINITASHNPREYNGYKAYWADGAQISPEQAEIVSRATSRIPVLGGAKSCDLEEAVKAGTVIVLGEETDNLYLQSVLASRISEEAVLRVADRLKIVYSPLHGAGYRLVPEVLRRAGLKYLYTVDSQMTPNGDFPTVKKPNPEYADVFSDGIAIAEREGSDLIIATDPDADRVGVMCRNSSGAFVTISGNQMGALLLDYVIRARRAEGTLSPAAYAVKSIVSTDMAYAIAKKNGVVLHDVLTGFKYIGEVIKNYEESGKAGQFLMGFEESYGYLFGSYARDKDAVGATLMIVEMAADYLLRGMTLSDALEELYRTYGVYREKMEDIYMEGLDGIARRRRLMEGLRSTPPVAFGGVPVSGIGDYLTGEIRDLKDGTAKRTGMPESDVLYYTLENGDKIIVRPSGTEPKVKIYFLAHGKDALALEAKLTAYVKDALVLAK